MKRVSLSGSPRRRMDRASRESVDSGADVHDVELPTDTEPTLLPGGLEQRPALLAALPFIDWRMAKDEKAFARGWITPACEQLFTCFAWHAVATHFRSGDAATDLAERLFSSLATAHTRLFTAGVVQQDPNVKDALIWYLPEALSHATVLALQKAFPKLSLIHI